MTGISDMSDEITENARVIENAQPAENIQSVKKAADNSGLYSGGVFRAGEKVQLTDRRLKKVTVQLVPGGLTSTEHGNIVHDDIIGKPEGTVTTTVSAKKKDSKTDSRKPWKNSTQTGGWQYSAMRPRLVDYVLSMPRGAQIMFPKDIAQVVSLADIRPGMKVLESGAGSGAMSLGILNAVGSRGKLVSIEIREDFAKIAMANAAVFFGERPQWWDIREGSFDSVAQTLEKHSFDRIVLDMLDPWNRLEKAYELLVPGAVLASYVTTVTQVSRLAEALRKSGNWTEPEIVETVERSWKSSGLAVRPNHQMTGHTGFIVVSRAMALEGTALKKRDRATKDTYTDVDELESLELRDISDRKIRKVIRDLDTMVKALPKNE